MIFRAPAAAPVDAAVLVRRRGIHRCGPRRQHDCPMTKRAEYTFALYSGRLADIGDTNPYNADQSPALAKLWTAGYMRMLRVRTSCGPVTP